MRDYIKRLIIAGIMALCISLLFLGGKHSQAEEISIKDKTNHWIWPSDGLITDTFGTRHSNHNGIDIAGPYGSPIYTVDDGVVTKAYYSYSYGNVIFIKHDNGLETVYAHLKARNVEEGQTVKQGDIIGEMGSTGDSSGVHLHFEVHQYEWTVNKENVIDPAIVLNQVQVGNTVLAFDEQTYSNEALEAIAKMRLYEGAELNYGHIMDNHIEVAVASESTEESTEQLVHMVQPGETLWSIAEQYHTTIESVKATNHIQGDIIVPNQKLKIQRISENQYIVRPYDNLSLIAAKTGTTVDQLVKLNKLSSEVIHPQQLLFLPKHE